MTIDAREPDETAKPSLLRELERLFLRNWKIILACALIGIFWGILELRSSVYTYPTQMQATAIQSSTDSGASRGITQLSGLASLANLALPSTSQNAAQFQLYIDSLYSRDLADEIAKHQDMMKILFGNQWDPNAQAWFEPPRSLTSRIWLWVRGLLGLAPTSPWQPPNGANVQSFLADHLAVSQDPRKTYLVTVTLTHYDKKFSVQFLNFLHQVANERLRQRALARARNYIAYLMERLQTTTVAEHRAAIAQSLSEQERFAMVASSGTPFAAEIFESPWASNLPAAPQPRAVLLIWAVIGTTIGMAMAYARSRWGVQMRGWASKNLRHS